MLLDGSRRIVGDLIVGGVTIGQAKVLVSKIDIKIGVYELGLDVVPQDARHFVPVQLYNGVPDFDLGHTVGIKRLGSR